MSGRKLRLPKSSDIIELATPGLLGSYRMPREWVIDYAYIGLLDKSAITRITKIKVDYLSKVVELEIQMKNLEAQMLKDLSKVLESKAIEG